MPVAGIGPTLRFGRFELQLNRRELRADGLPVQLGSRAFDILALLVEARGTLVSKEQILSAVWPGVVVEESNLQVQVSALRKVLAEHRDAVHTVPGRGYRFIVPRAGASAVSPGDGDEATTVSSAAPAAVLPALALTNLPAATSALVGREAELAEVVARLGANRLVTLTGPGGIGKTRLGLAAGRALLQRFADGVWIAELATLADPALVPGAVATALGLDFTVGAISAERMAQALADKRLLLVLDNCEHVIDEAARLAEALLRATPGLRLLATSQEPLRLEGESVVRVPPLALPPQDAASSSELLDSAAVRLFMALARAAEPQLEADARLAAIASAICRRLDGIPLAIELAAARVPALGVEGVAARLDDRFRLLTGGWRTALRRHQTLRGALDWSYEALSDGERAVLRRLAIFPGSFTLDAAGAVLAAGDIGPARLPAHLPAHIIEHVGALASKSLLIAEVGSDKAQYRLLETTRAYALEKLAESGEAAEIARRHAAHVLDLLARAQGEWAALPAAQWLPRYRGQMDNVRAALDWAFAPQGDAALGADLALAAVPLWRQLSLMEECRVRIERALAVLGAEADRPVRRTMQLHEAHGQSLMYTKGAIAETGAALARALAVADVLGDDDYRRRALWGLWFNRLNNGGAADSFALAERYAALAEASGDPIDPPVADRMLGFTLHFLGDPVAARAHLERMLARPAVVRRLPQIPRFQFDQWVTARITLAEILWLLGLPDQAMRMVEHGVDEAIALDHALTLRNVLAKACPVALYAGDLDAAERFLAMLLDHSTRHALAFWRSEGHCFEGVLAIRRGDVAGGVAMLQTALEEQPETRFALRYNAFLGELADGLGRLGDVEQGLAAIDTALARAQHGREHWCTAELLRTKGELLIVENAAGAAAAAAAHFRRALDAARRQRALSWELRAATSLARVEPSAETRDLLAAVYGRFAEGFATADLQAAKRLLDALS